jgi:hypothetical protein
MTTKPKKKHIQVKHTDIGDAFGSASAKSWLSLDQIKPIGQLVPVN